MTMSEIMGRKAPDQMRTSSGAEPISAAALPPTGPSQNSAASGFASTEFLLFMMAPEGAADSKTASPNSAPPAETPQEAMPKKQGGRRAAGASKSKQEQLVPKTPEKPSPQKPGARNTGGGGGNELCG